MKLNDTFIGLFALLALVIALAMLGCGVYFLFLMHSFVTA